MIRSYLAVAALFLFAGCAARTPAQPCPCSTVTMKDLQPMVGRWQGKSSSGEKFEVVTRETSGGSAIEETLSPGTSHEMVSMYYGNQSGVEMTHYCMLGNQPILRAEKISANEILFQFAGGTNITPGKGHYMSEMRLTFLDPNRIREEWSSTMDGKRSEPSVFEFQRIGTAPAAAAKRTAMKRECGDDSKKTSRKRA